MAPVEILVIVLNVFVPITNWFPLAPVIVSDKALPSISVPLTVNVVEVWFPPSAVNNFTYPPYPVWLFIVPKEVLAATIAEEIRFISRELL